ncbi:class II aldolase/adducin family protein [Planctomycetales bacterium ZRK34]|nr:class II aldolase/adducin family protein [Planctomycetales bacterium ZRK34]
MAPSIYKVKQDMCDIGKRIWQRGYCAGNEGNHSVRVDKNRVLCTPTGISKGFLRPEMICMVDMENKVLEANKGYKPSSEVKIHLQIYKTRDDIGAVVHSHPPHATAFAVAGIPLPEGIHPEAEVFLGRVPTAQYATPSKQDLADSLIPHIKAETSAILMANHGSVTFDKDLTGAYYRLEILDAYSRILLLAKQLGKVNMLDSKQMYDLLEVKQQFGFNDPRLSCAADGCIGSTQNQPFLTMFDARPASAVCDANGTVQSHGGASTSTVSDESFEQMVQTITDQIMASR